MILPRPDIEELALRIKSEISYRALRGAPVLPMSIEDVMSYVFAGALYQQYGAIEQFYRELDPETASCDGLYIWARRRGLYPSGATSAKGFITVTGSVLGVVPIDATWTSQNGSVFSVDPLSGPISLNSLGSAVVPIRAISPGASSNVLGNTSLSLVQTVVGINTLATTTQSGVSGGSEVEDCEKFRSRILTSRRSGILSTNADWLLSQVYLWPGMTRACLVDCGPCNNCVGSYVEIAVFFDGVYGPYGVPDQCVLDQMNLWLFGSSPGKGLGRAPIGIHGAIVSAQPTFIDIEVACTSLCPTSSQSTLKSILEDRLKDLICSGGKLCKADLDFIIKSFIGRSCISTAAIGFSEDVVRDNGSDLIFDCKVFPVLRNLIFQDS